MAVVAAITGSVMVVQEMLDDDEDDIRLKLFALTSLLRNDQEKSKGYFESTIPNYLPDTFRRFFRMSRTTCEILCQHLATCPELLSRTYRGGRPEVPLEKAVLMTLKYLASQETVLEISDRFDVTEYTFLKYRKLIINAINNSLMSKFIAWPDAAELPDLAESFDAMGLHHFPNVIGAVDGSHIAIESPHDNPQAYYNRKKFFSVILQGVCKDNLQFIDINVGYPGRVHDAKVLRNSHLWQTGDGRCQNGRYHILGDGAYPLQRWLLTPYRNTGNLTPNQLHFNQCLSSKRQVVERAFGLLKGRFRRLRHIHLSSICDTCNLIAATVVLHNMCIFSGDELQDFMDVDEDIGGNDQQLVNFPENNAEGRLKRIRITNQIGQ